MAQQAISASGHRNFIWTIKNSGDADSPPLTLSLPSKVTVNSGSTCGQSNYILSANSTCTFSLRYKASSSETTESVDFSYSYTDTAKGSQNLSHKINFNIFPGLYNVTKNIPNFTGLDLTSTWIYQTTYCASTNTLYTATKSGLYISKPSITNDSSAYVMQKYTTDDGLADNDIRNLAVNCLTNMLYAGTSNGLSIGKINTDDGTYSFTTYTSSNTNKHLLDNSIGQLYLDATTSTIYISLANGFSVGNLGSDGAYTFTQPQLPAQEAPTYNQHVTACARNSIGLGNFKVSNARINDFGIGAFPQIPYYSLSSTPPFSDISTSGSRTVQYCPYTLINSIKYLYFLYLDVSYIMPKTSCGGVYYADDIMPILPCGLRTAINQSPKFNVTSIVPSPDGSLYIGKTNGLSIATKEAGDSYSFTTMDIPNIPTGFISEVYVPNGLFTLPSTSPYLNVKVNPKDYFLYSGLPSDSGLLNLYNIVARDQRQDFIDKLNKILTDNLKTLSSTTNNLLEPFVFNIQTNSTGNKIYIGTRTGLSIATKGSDEKLAFQHYVSINGLANNGITRIFVDNTNETLYLGTNGGMSIGEKQADGSYKFTSITQGNNFLAILPDHDGTLYTTLSGGLFAQDL